MVHFHKLLDFHSDLCYSFLVDNVHGTLDMEDCIYRNICTSPECPCEWYKTELGAVYDSEVNKFDYYEQPTDVDGEPLFDIISEPADGEELDFNPDRYQKSKIQEDV